MADPISAGIAAVATVGGGLLSSRASGRAASTQADAATQAAALQAEATREQIAAQERMFERQVELQEPFRAAGVTAINQLTPLATQYTPFGMDQFQQDPGYAFRMSEGMKALDRQAAARGGLISGAALRGAQRFGQELGSQEYGAAFNRYQAERNALLNPLQSLAGVGQTSAGQLASGAGQTGTNLSNIIGSGAAAQGQALGAAGQARASGYMGQSNALNATLGNLGNIAGQYFAGRPSSNFLGGMSSMGTAVPTTYGPVGDLGSFGGLY
jgi:hypothetical protein